MDEGEIPSFSLAPYHMQQVGDQALWPVPAATLRTADPAPHLDRTVEPLHVGVVGELPLGFKCVSLGATSSLLCSGIGKGKDLLHSLLPLPLMEDRRVGPMGV